ncbi:MAG: hypothetical protein P8X58_15770 [Syntrophobacterales bacterium]
MLDIKAGADAHVARLQLRVHQATGRGLHERHHDGRSQHPHPAAPQMSRGMLFLHHQRFFVGHSRFEGGHGILL